MRYGADDIERVVREFEIGGIHLQEPDRRGILPGRTLTGLLQHRRREVDPRHRRLARIQRKVDPRADADFEHPLARLDVHALDGLQAAGMQGRTEDQVVDFRQLVVDSLDEIVFDGSHGERSRGGVSCHVLGLVFSIE